MARLYEILQNHHRSWDMAPRLVALFIGLALVLFISLTFPDSAWANRLRPGISAELGFTDNIKFRSGQDDFFFRITPRIDVSMGPPENNFTANAAIGWTQYFVHTDESDIESANIALVYNRDFSPRWNFNISNTTTVSYDIIEQDINNQTISDTPPGTQSYSNTTTVSSQYRWGEFENVQALYRFRWNRFENDTDEARHNYSNLVRVSGQARISPKWRPEASVEIGRSDDEIEEDTWLVTTRAGIVRMIGPNREAFLRLNYSIGRVDTDDPLISGERDYDRVGIIGGADWAFSPVFTAGFSFGVDYVFGDEELNTAAGDFYPDVSVFATYTGQTWSVSGRLASSLEDTSLDGRNSGLNFTNSASLAYTWSLAQHWLFFANLAVVYREPLQETVFSTSVNQNEQITYSANTGINWQVARNTTLGLKYKFDYRDSETATENQRYRNEVSLIISTYQDFLW